MRHADSDFEVTAGELWGRLVNALWLMTRDRERSEELAQEALVRLWENWGKVQNPAAWTFAVGFNLARSSLRRKSRERKALEAATGLRDRMNVRGVTPTDVVESHRTRALLATLPFRQREVVVRRYYLDQSISDIARAIGCAEGTVKSHLHRAQRRIESRITDKEVNDART